MSRRLHYVISLSNLYTKPFYIATTICAVIIFFSSTAAELLLDLDTDDMIGATLGCVILLTFDFYVFGELQLYVKIVIFFIGVIFFKVFKLVCSLASKTHDSFLAAFQAGPLIKLGYSSAQAVQLILNVSTIPIVLINGLALIACTAKQYYIDKYQGGIQFQDSPTFPTPQDEKP